MQPGFQIRWQFGAGADLLTATPERSEAADGPWSAVAGDRRDQGTATVAIDDEVEAGRTYYDRLVVTLVGGHTMTFGPLAATAGPASNGFELVSVAPNPSRGAVSVEFTVPREAMVKLTVLDVQGRLVALLADGQKPPGRYLTSWDGTGVSGRAAAGLYFVRYEAPGMRAVRRVVLAR